MQKKPICFVMLENEQNLSSEYIASGATVLEKPFLFWSLK